VKTVLRTGGTFVLATVGAIIAELMAAVRFLAANAQPHAADDELNSAIRGGEFNFRTHRFDDGLDPAGMYDID